MSRSDSEEDYYLPLEDQRVFGAGIKRKRIAFVPAKHDHDTVTSQHTSTSTGLGDRYLSIVLGTEHIQENSSVARAADESKEMEICNVCKQPIISKFMDDGGVTSGTHESSIAHQVCLSHSHPPSHLPREHVGVRYLTEHGWDPDARTGLGARQEGIRVPVKAREKKDTAGLGLGHEEEGDTIVKRKVAPLKAAEGKVVKKLDAGKLRKLEIENKKRAEKLRQSFYGEDFSRYLGPDDG